MKEVVSVNAWIEECKTREENPVLLHKQQGEVYGDLKVDDFVLVILSSTQWRMLEKFGSDRVVLTARMVQQVTTSN